MTDDRIPAKVDASLDPDRRRCVFKIAKATAATAAAVATLYMAPLALRIDDEAEAKGSKRRRKGPSRRRAKMPSRRRRRRFPTRR
jgi:hypothetical protein